MQEALHIFTQSINTCRLWTSSSRVISSSTHSEMAHTLTCWSITSTEGTTLSYGFGSFMTCISVSRNKLQLSIRNMTSDKQKYNFGVRGKLKKNLSNKGSRSTHAIVGIKFQQRCSTNWLVTRKKTTVGLAVHKRTHTSYSVQKLIWKVPHSALKRKRTPRFERHFWKMQVMAISWNKSTRFSATGFRDV